MPTFEREIPLAGLLFVNVIVSVVDAILRPLDTAIDLVLKLGFVTEFNKLVPVPVDANEIPDAGLLFVIVISVPVVDRLTFDPATRPLV